MMRIFRSLARVRFGGQWGDGFTAARCTVERLMRAIGLKGVVRRRSAGPHSAMTARSSRSSGSSMPSGRILGSRVARSMKAELIVNDLERGL
jgi:hypothetical protein